MKQLLVIGLYKLLILLSSASAALDIVFDQELQQGALVSGKTTAKELELFGRTINVDTEGRFVFGLGRDTEARVILTMLGAGGERKEFALNVTQRQYDTESIEGVAQKYVSPPSTVLERIRSDTAQVKAARATYSPERWDYLEDFTWPSDGRISGVYGSQRIFNGVPKRPHYGLDIAAPTGAPVVAPVSGKVTLAHEDMYYSGGTLIIDHGRGVSSTYIHLSKLHVKVGDEVKQGQRIADVGATGRVTGPHLDWRINWFDQRLDPQLLVPIRD